MTSRYPFVKNDFNILNDYEYLTPSELVKFLSMGSDGDQGEDELDCGQKSSAPFLPRLSLRSTIRNPQLGIGTFHCTIQKNISDH